VRRLIACIKAKKSMSRHSSASAQDLVKSNQELRSTVLDLQDKLARSEAAIKTAIAAATDGYHHGGSNLSVTTHPSTILSLAESIASNSNAGFSPALSPHKDKGSRGAVDSHTPPLSVSGTSADRIDRLVASNRELRHAVSDKDAKIGKALQEVEALKQHAKAQESKIALLYEDVERADKALQNSVEDAAAMARLPAQWEKDKARLVAAQDKERDHMIELLNRERSDKEDMRVGYEEALQRALAAQAEGAAAVSAAAQLTHAQELHAQQEARELEKRQAQLEIDHMSELLTGKDAELADAYRSMAAQRAVAQHQLKVGQGSTAADVLMSLPMAAQRQLQLPLRTSYAFFPLELSAADYAARVLRLLDAAVRPAVAQRLLQAARSSPVYLKMQVPPSPAKEAWELRAELEEQQRQPMEEEKERYHVSPSPRAAPSIAVASELEELFVPIQALLSVPAAVSHASTSAQERHTFSLDAFLALSPPPKTPKVPAPKTAQSPVPLHARARDGAAAVAFAVATESLPASPLDLLALFLQKSPHAELADSLAVLRSLEGKGAEKEAPNATCFDAARKIILHFQDFDATVSVADMEDRARCAGGNNAALQSLQALEGQAETHSRFKATRLAVMGWKSRDVPAPAESPPAIVHTMNVLIDTIRFSGVASDANQLSRMCRPLVVLLALLRPQIVKDNCRFWCRLRQWKVKLREMEGASVEELVEALESMLDTPISSTCPANSEMSALLEFVQTDELLDLSLPTGEGVTSAGVTATALMRYICLVSSVALDSLDVLAAVHRRAEEERELQAAAQLQALRTQLQELVAVTLEVDTRAVFAYPERAVNAHLLHSPEHLLRRTSLGDCESVACCFLSADGVLEASPESDSKGFYCIRTDAAAGVPASGRWTQLLAPLVPDAVVMRSEGKGRQRISAGFVWEAPYSCEGQGGFDAFDRLSCASLALRTRSPMLLLLAYRTLSGLKLRVPLSTFQLMVAQRQHRASPQSAQTPVSVEELMGGSKSQDKRLPCVDPLDPQNQIVPSAWVAEFAAGETALPGPVALRRAYGVSIFTLMDCRLFARVDVLRACAFSVVDLTQQNTYHAARLSSACSAPLLRRTAPVGSALEYIHGEIINTHSPTKATPDKAQRKSSMSRRASLSPGAAGTSHSPGGANNGFFLSEDGHHFSLFLALELKAAGVNARDARQVLAANPQQLQLGGFDDASIVTQAGFSLSELTSCGAVRINQYSHVQKLVLAEFYRHTSAGAPVSAIRLDRKDADNVKHEGWRRDFNWCSSRPIGDWYGITTDSRKNVIKIDLRGNRLRGALPTCLRLLQTLEVFDVHDNELTGPLPLWLAELPSLKVLNIHTNFLDQTAESQQTLSVLSKALPDCLIRA